MNTADAAVEWRGWSWPIVSSWRRSRRPPIRASAGPFTMLAFLAAIHFRRAWTISTQVVASLLYKLAGRIILAGGVPGCDVEKAAELQAYAEANIASRWVPQSGTVACDVILAVTRPRIMSIGRSIVSWNSDSDHVFLHLVNDGGGGTSSSGAMPAQPRIHI